MNEIDLLLFFESSVRHRLESSRLRAVSTFFLCYCTQYTHWTTAISHMRSNTYDRDTLHLKS
jgi:hypothetical protein